jgi:hypothetical protein
MVINKSRLDPTVTSREVATFRAKAFAAAFAKARKLGWIV